MSQAETKPVEISNDGDSFHVELNLGLCASNPYYALNQVYSLIEIDKGELINKIQKASGLSKERILEYYEVRCATQALIK